MKRLVRMVGILGIAALLAGCDKCGDVIKFTLFDDPPKTCSAGNPQG